MYNMLPICRWLGIIFINNLPGHIYITFSIEYSEIAIVKYHAVVQMPYENPLLFLDGLFSSEADLIIKAIVVIPKLLAVGDISNAAVERLDSWMNQSPI